MHFRNEIIEEIIIFLYIAAHNKNDQFNALFSQSTLRSYSNDCYLYFRFQTMIDSVKRELHTAKVQLSTKSS